MGTMQCNTKNPIGIMDMKIFYYKINLSGNGSGVSPPEKKMQNRLIRRKNTPACSKFSYENQTLFVNL